MHRNKEKAIRLTAPSFIREDERGSFIEIVNEGPWETIIQGEMKTGAKMGKHYHRECRAYFYIIEGRASVKIHHLIDGTEDTITLKGKQGLYFLPFELHTVTYLQDSSFLLLKSYRYKPDQPDIYVNEISSK